MKLYYATIETMEEASAAFDLRYAVLYNEGLESASTKLADACQVSRGQSVAGEIGETSGLVVGTAAAVGALAADGVRSRPPCGHVLRVGLSGVSDCETCTACNRATETYQERAGEETVGGIRLQAKERRVWIVAGCVRERGHGR